MIAELAAEARVDLLVFQERVRADRVRDLALVTAEADGPSLRSAGRKDPVESVQSPLVEGRVVLERQGQTRREGALGAAVGSVQQQEAIDLPTLREVGEGPVDLHLHRLVTDEAFVRLREG